MTKQFLIIQKFGFFYIKNIMYCYKYDMTDSFILISGLWRAKNYFSKNVSEVVWLNV